jgi:hypothetical protein
MQSSPNDTAGSIERCRPMRLAISSGCSRIGSQNFPPPASPPSRVESTRNRLRAGSAALKIKAIDAVRDGKVLRPAFGKVEDNSLLRRPPRELSLNEAQIIDRQAA